MSLLLQQHLSNYEELFHAKEISITKNISEGIVLTMNETLADILIVNLLINAIKHNTERGSVTIELNKKHLSIINTGNILNANPAIYFERLKKESASNDSMGLGLSIVKKICGTYGFKICYTYEKMMHNIVVDF
jgi:signal transduction histidine kinase